MDGRVTTRGRKKERGRVRRETTSDEETVTKRIKPSTSNAANGSAVKRSSESSSAESSSDGTDEESKSRALYVEAVHNAYVTAKEIVEKREKESKEVTNDSLALGLSLVLATRLKEEESS